MRITARKLGNKGICSYPLCVFKKEWPNGVEVTLENLFRAAELSLDLEWFARKFLSPPMYYKYLQSSASINIAYRDATPSALMVYLKTMTPTLGAYNKAIATALYRIIEGGIKE